jgi:hypothetical protein
MPFNSLEAAELGVKMHLQMLKLMTDAWLPGSSSEPQREQEDTASAFLKPLEIGISETIKDAIDA